MRKLVLSIAAAGAFAGAMLATAPTIVVRQPRCTQCSRRNAR